MRKILLFLLIFFAFSTNSKSEQMSGSEFYKLLETDLYGEPTYGAGYASGYVVGVFSSLSGVVICAPTSGITVRQVKQVVFNYMQKHPESWNRSIVTIIETSFNEVWPCH